MPPPYRRGVRLYVAETRDLTLRLWVDARGDQLLGRSGGGQQRMGSLHGASEIVANSLPDSRAEPVLVTFRIMIELARSAVRTSLGHPAVAEVSRLVQPPMSAVATTEVPFVGTAAERSNCSVLLG